MKVINKEYFQNISLIILITIGTFFLYLNIFLPWIPILCVLVFGYIVYKLYYNDYKLFKLKSDIIYFLGFLFTLISFIMLGLNMPQNIESLNYIPVMINYLSSAVTTTVVGIAFRSIFNDIANTKLVMIEEKDYSTYLKEIAEAHMNFKSLHDKTIVMFEKFIESTIKSIEYDKTEKERLSNTIKKIVNELDKIFSNEIPKIKNIIQSTYTETMNMSNKILNNSKSFIEKYNDDNQAFLLKSKEFIQKMITELNELSNEYIKNKEIQFNNILEKHFNNFETLSSDFLEKYNKKFSQSFINISSSLFEFNKNFESLNKEILTTSHNISLTNSVMSQSPESLKKFEVTIQKMKKNIDNYDDVLDSFCDAITERSKKIIGSL